MIKYDLTGRNFEVDRKVRDYIEDKICGLDRYLPKHARQTAFANIVLALDNSNRENNQYVCEVILTVQGGKLMSKEGTINIYAAVDIVEAKLKAQMHKYKEKHTTQTRRAKMLYRLIGRKSETDTSTPVAE